MKKLSKLILTIFLLVVSVGYSGQKLYAQLPSFVNGVVFHDKNGNGHYDGAIDLPLAGVAVSNGKDVVVTNEKGEYKLPFRDNAATFVIKPRNWSVSVDENNMPLFYKFYSSSGLSGTKYEGLPATGLPTAPVNFAMQPSEEPDNLKVLVFGDTQPRNEQEIFYMSNKVLSEVAGTDADFGVVLGDVVFDDLLLHDPITEYLSNLGVPMWYALGNHDIDYTGNNNMDARGAWYRKFGPSYYSFSYGPAHFVVLDNIWWIVEGDQRQYRTGLGEDQLEFLRNEVDRLDKNTLLVILAHIPFERSTPWQDNTEKEKLYKILSTHPKSLSLVAHRHLQYHHFLGEEEGFPGAETHHMISMGAVCGAWWTGMPDEYGIPHAMMTDGTPIGYAFLHINRNDWKLEWKAAQRPFDYQMNIHAPDFVSLNDQGEFKVFANIFNALPDAVVKMRIGDKGEWIEMNRVPQINPIRLAAKEIENQLDRVSWRKMGNESESTQIWEASFKTDGLNPGTYSIYIEAKDQWHEYEEKRLIRFR